ncbi:hypothetical protein AU252_01635 [Pseudarthrobacter sulfonivorans]|uniref:Uncharacterized protein n=2 Tax=Pseudarthrobacter sulfonivorans TaxID=121292 RepID=A0A0U3QT08_9MICC|nr:hypothetical protein AU252_01635 [Pseudarthrobacter sulfonivorans]
MVKRSVRFQKWQDLFVDARETGEVNRSIDSSAAVEMKDLVGEAAFCRIQGCVGAAAKCLFPGTRQGSTAMMGLAPIIRNS